MRKPNPLTEDHWAHGEVPRCLTCENPGSDIEEYRGYFSLVERTIDEQKQALKGQGET